MKRNRRALDWRGGAEALSRREVLAGLASVSVFMSMRADTAIGEDEVTTQFKTAYAKLVGVRVVSEEGIRLTLPDIAENGNMVPFTVYVDSPMTEENHVKTITIFSTGNPQPVIGTFHLSSASGRALVGGRLRLARSQDVVVIAEVNSGALVSGRGNVKVTIGGCGTG